MVRSLGVWHVSNLHDVTYESHLIALFIVHNLLLILTLCDFNQVAQVVLGLDGLNYKLLTKVSHLLNLSFDFGSQERSRLLP